MNFGPLRVINEDKVKPGAGFDTHGHRDMEIISYVLEGALEHKDSTGTGSVIRPGDIQRMSAGSGILHSEYNHSKEEPVHFLQIWIMPNETGIDPGYEQKRFADDPDLRNGLKLVAGPKGSDTAVKLHADARLFVSQLDAGNSVYFDIDPGRGIWLQVARGEVSIDDQRLAQGDGASLTEESAVTITAESDAEFLLFDLPEH
jgi:redox-sensitive bicupin YhaK (pirin superfamily)